MSERKFIVTFQTLKSEVESFLSDREYLLRILAACQTIPEVESGLITFMAEPTPFGNLKPPACEGEAPDPVIPRGEKKMVVAVLMDKEPPDKEGRQRFDLFWLDTWPHDMSQAYMESKGIKYKPGEHYVRGQCYRSSLVAQKQRIESQRGMAFFVWDREPTVEDFLAYENS